MAIHIFDIDDTLIATKAQVIIKDSKGNEIGRLGSHAFNLHQENPLEAGMVLENATYDFSEFESLKQLTTEPILPAMAVLRSLDPCSEQTYIVTARQKQGLIWQWLHDTVSDALIPFTNIFCYDRESGLSVAEWKAEVVKHIIENSDKTDIHIHEDNDTNMQAMLGQVPIDWEVFTYNLDK